MERWLLLVALVPRLAWGDVAVPGEQKEAAPASLPTGREVCFDRPAAQHTPTEAIDRAWAAAVGRPDEDPEKPLRVFEVAKLALGNSYFFAAQPDEKQAKEWLKSGVKMHLLLTNNPRWRGFGKMDEVLWNLASLLMDQKRGELARPIFLRLIKEYPTSIYVPGAYASFGDYYFDEHDMEHALQLYDKVMQFPPGRCRAYVTYKAALGHQQLGDHRRAIEMLVRLLKNEKPSAELAAAARYALVVNYVEVGAPEKARPFFENVAGPEGPEKMLKEYDRLRPRKIDGK